MGEHEHADYQVLSSTPIFDGRVLHVRLDEIRMSDGSVAEREIVGHPGAVGVVALDEAGNVVIVNQYRAPVDARLDELPAGLLDVNGESALDAAKRELVEEAHLLAGEWYVLLDLHTSPGMTDEAIRIYLARDLSPSGDDFVAEHEELTLTVSRVPLAEMIDRALGGRMTNATAVAGILAAGLGSTSDWRGLRPADAPWPGRPGR